MCRYFWPLWPDYNRLLAAFFVAGDRRHAAEVDFVKRQGVTGRHLRIAAQLYQTGAYFTAQSHLTAPLSCNFDTAGRVSGDGGSLSGVP